MDHQHASNIVIGTSNDDFRHVELRLRESGFSTIKILFYFRFHLQKLRQIFYEPHEAILYFNLTLIAAHEVLFTFTSPGIIFFN